MGREERTEGAAQDAASSEERSPDLDLFWRRRGRAGGLRRSLLLRHLAPTRGPTFEHAGLRDARKRLETLRMTQPALAQRIGSNALLVRIYESEARKLLVTAGWYRSVGDPVSSEQYIRRLVTRYPDSVATRDALRGISSLLAELPESVVREAPDYDALAQALLGAPLENASGVPARPETLLPERATLDEHTTPQQASASEDRDS